MLSWIELDAESLKHNFNVFAGLVGKQKLAPVLKSNAYGHGLKEIYGVLASEAPAWICVNYLFEATELRTLGYKGRLLVVGPFTHEQFDEAVAARADVFIGSDETLEHVLKSKAKLNLHIEFDTGMSRQGFSPRAAAAVAAKLQKKKDQVVGICMHFANVEDVFEHEYATQQLRRFDTAIKEFHAAGLKPLAHAASSASCLLLKDGRFDLERVGISLYGFWPSQATRLSFSKSNDTMIELRPVLSWRTKISSTIPVEAGQFVGYGCTYRANQDMRIAVVPVGYYEGYPRLASGSSSYVLIRGRRCQIVGRICMNMMMVDVTHLDGPKIGEVATLIGNDGAETIHASEVATWAQTIHYEIVTRLLGSIPRRVV